MAEVGISSFIPSTCFFSFPVIRLRHSNHHIPNPEHKPSSGQNILTTPQMASTLVCYFRLIHVHPLTTSYHAGTWKHHSLCHYPTDTTERENSKLPSAIIEQAPNLFVTYASISLILPLSDVCRVEQDMQKQTLVLIMRRCSSQFLQG